MQAHKARVDAEIRGVLQPDQRKRFDQLLEEQGKRFPMLRKGKHRARPGRRGVREKRADRKRRARPQQRRGLVDRFDADGDDQLSEAEVPARTWKRIAKADANGDGLLTAEELKAWRKARREKRRERRRGAGKGAPE
jgi:hypothetical protein